VLYDLFLDERGHDVNPWPKDSLIRTQPDVEVFDARSGKSLLRFRTGGWEDGISFSRDGQALWCISANRSDIFWGRDIIRIFSSSDGRLMRTIKAGGWGLRGNFAISPSGRLVVADASRIVPYFLKEADICQKIGRFVLLDAQTGEVLFRYHRRTTGFYIYPSHFAFTSDERYLLVDPNHFHGGPGPRVEEHVDVYIIK
jgi:WD40 repeat protein